MVTALEQKDFEDFEDCLQEKCAEEVGAGVSETGKYVDDGIFFGRYRKGKIKL